MIYVNNLDIKTPIMATLLILVFSVLFIPSTFANEGCTNNGISITKPDKSDDATIHQAIDTNDTALKKEIKLLADLNDGYYADGIKLARNEGDNTGVDETEFVYTKAAVSEYETESIEAGDILRSIPSISTEDNKTLGLIIPPFAYFAKKF